MQGKCAPEPDGLVSSSVAQSVQHPCRASRSAHSGLQRPKNVVDPSTERGPRGANYSFMSSKARPRSMEPNSLVRCSVKG